MDRTLDLEAAAYCEHAYDNPEKLKDQAVSDVIHVEGPEHGADAFVFETETHNWVVFRGLDAGTAEYLGDFKTALDSYRQRIDGYERLRLHRGFFRAWQEIADIVYEESYLLSVRQQVDEGVPKPTIYAGHSAGGALAMLAAATHVPHALITFGAPRVGGEAFVRKLDKLPRNHRWVNGSDLVSLYPFGFGYRHGGTEFLVDKDGGVTESPGFWKKLWETVRDLRNARDNHRMTSYWWAVMGFMFEEDS